MMGVLLARVLFSEVMPLILGLEMGSGIVDGIGALKFRVFTAWNYWGKLR